jgi:hypothetical protein
MEGGAAAKGPVVVTGAAGFLGSWLVMKLLQAGYAVRATVRDPGGCSLTLLYRANASRPLDSWRDFDLLHRPSSSERCEDEAAAGPSRSNGAAVHLEGRPGRGRQLRRRDQGMHRRLPRRHSHGLRVQRPRGTQATMQGSPVDFCTSQRQSERNLKFGDRAWPRKWPKTQV